MISRLNILKNTLSELFKEILPLLEQFAPSFGAVLGGPPGFAAGFAVPLLAHAFGANPHNTQDIVNKIKSFGNTQENTLRSLEDQYGIILRGLLDNLTGLSKAKIHVELEWDNQPKPAA